VNSQTTDLHLSIEVGSDPISGSVDGGQQESSRFSGWIELVAVIESARQARAGGREQRLGSFPGVKPAES
jgi:hypothetical protein